VVLAASPLASNVAQLERVQETEAAGAGTLHITSMCELWASFGLDLT